MNVENVVKPPQKPTQKERFQVFVYGTPLFGQAIYKSEYETPQYIDYERAERKRHFRMVLHEI